MNKEKEEEKSMDKMKKIKIVIYLCTTQDVEFPPIVENINS